MTHRSTIVTRIRTEEGIVGEAYCGDEDAGLHEIDAILRTEIAPRLHRRGRLPGRALLGARPARDVRHPPRPAARARRDRVRRRRDLGRDRQGARPAAPPALGRLPRQPPGDHDRRLLREPGHRARRSAELRERGLAGMKFKVGGLTPEEDAARFRIARARRRAGLRPLRRREPGLDAGRGDPLRTARRRPRPATGSRSRASGRTTAAPCATSASAAGVRVCAGQSEFSAGGCRDLMVEGAIDFCNFDASWSGGADGVAARRRGRALAFDVAMAHHEEPQVAAHLLASIPHGTFLEVFSADRDPIWWNLVANRPPIVDGRMALPTGPGLGWELDARLHRGVPGLGCARDAGARRCAAGSARGSTGAASSSPARSAGSGRRSRARSPLRRAGRGRSTCRRARLRGARRHRCRATGTSASAPTSPTSRTHDGAAARAPRQAVGPLVALVHLAAVLRRQARHPRRRRGATGTPRPTST